MEYVEKQICNRYAIQNGGPTLEKAKPKRRKELQPRKTGNRLARWKRINPLPLPCPPAYPSNCAPQQTLPLPLP